MGSDKTRRDENTSTVFGASDRKWILRAESLEPVLLGTARIRISAYPA
jgi:hypothetical protein